MQLSENAHSPDHQWLQQDQGHQQHQEHPTPQKETSLINYIPHHQQETSSFLFAVSLRTLFPSTLIWTRGMTLMHFSSNYGDYWKLFSGAQCPKNRGDQMCKLRTGWELVNSGPSAPVNPSGEAGVGWFGAIKNLLIPRKEGSKSVTLWVLSSRERILMLTAR